MGGIVATADYLCSWRQRYGGVRDQPLWALALSGADGQLQS